MPASLPTYPNLQFQVKIDLEGMARGPRLGRNAWDGYFRGCALQYAKLFVDGGRTFLQYWLAGVDEHDRAELKIYEIVDMGMWNVGMCMPRVVFT